MPEPVETARAAAPARGAVLRTLFGSVRLAYLPVLVTYFCYGASGITSIALLYFQKDTLGITPAEAAAIAFWVALPWSTKMVAGVASDVHPIFGRRRVSYLLLGALLAFAGYGWLATTASTKATYLAAMVIIAVGFMVQDVVADALSVELARNDEEVKQIQTLGRMALLAGTISVGYLSGWLAGALGPRLVFAIALVLPALVMVAACADPARDRPRGGARGRRQSPGRGQVAPRGVGGARLRGARRRAGGAVGAVRPGDHPGGLGRPHRDAAPARRDLPRGGGSPPSPSSASGPCRPPGRGSATGRSITSASIRSSWACSRRWARC